MNVPSHPNLLIEAILRMNREITAEIAVVPEAPSPDQLLDTEMLAGLLMVSQRTIANWRTKRIGPPITRVGSSVRYRYRDVLAWIAEQHAEP